MVMRRYVALLLLVLTVCGQYDLDDNYRDHRGGDGLDPLDRGRHLPSDLDMDYDGHSSGRKNMKISDTYTVIQGSSQKCEKITVPLCSTIQYNQTQFPNILNHHTQEEAGEDVMQFAPLVKVNCNQWLKFFLCSVYIPFCSGMPTPVPPCRSLCEDAKKGCENLMNKFGFQWPEPLRCSRFPTEQPCVVYNGSKDDSSRHPHSGMAVPMPGSFPNQNLGGTPVEDPFYGTGHGIGDAKIEIQSGNTGSTNIDANQAYVQVAHDLDQYILSHGRPKLAADKRFTCFPDYKVSSSASYHFDVLNETLTGCGVPCRKTFFTDYERKIVRYWVVGWSVLCAVSTAFTCLTFLTDRRRFMYPERPIIFLSMCFLFISVCYIIGFVLHHNWACNSDQTDVMKTVRQSLQKRKFTASVAASVVTKFEGLYEQVVTMGSEVAGCTILAGVYYFFTMAAAAWWVILTFTWFQAAGLKWSHEAIEAKSHFFHLAVWLFASVMSVSLLGTRNIDGDPLSGICGVGNWNTETLQVFIIAPMAICLVLGILFFLSGFVSLIRIRKFMKNDDSVKIEKLEKLMLKISVFSVFYNVPTIISLACYVYEALLLDTWLFTWYREWCKANKQFPCSPLVTNDPAAPARPEFVVFMIKYLMILMVGITSGFWVWSKKTLIKWGSCDPTCFTAKSPAMTPPPSHPMHTLTHGAGGQPKPEIPGAAGVPFYSFPPTEGLASTEMHYYHQVQSQEATAALLPQSHHHGLPTPSTSTTLNPVHFGTNRTPAGAYNNQQSQMAPLFRP